MPKTRAYRHPSYRVKSVERAMPRTGTRNEHPKCEDCPSPADFSIEFANDTGSGYLDLCNQHLVQELQEDAQLSAKLLVGLLHQSLPSVLPKTA
jgi:hypothetical protein